MRNYLVLGTRDDGKENIGNGIRAVLEAHEGVTVEGRNCAVSDGGFHIPERTPLWWGRFDGLIVSLGKSSVKPFEHQGVQEMYEVVMACLVKPLIAAQRYVDGRGKRGGKIVFIGSYAHRHPFSAGTAYCAAKAGLDMAVRTLGWELTDKGFYTTVVHPYHVFGTPMWEEVQEGVMKTKGMTREEADAYAEKDLKMRPLKPVHIGKIVSNFLLNDTYDHMSGSHFELFGGTR